MKRKKKQKQQEQQQEYYNKFTRLLRKKNILNFFKTHITGYVFKAFFSRTRFVVRRV